ncbi:hypothetical protein KI387_035999, partial [Taxus chinensis]
LEALEADMKLLKDEVKNLAKQKGKRKKEEEVAIDNSQIEDIYKKMNSLDSRLGKAKTRHDYNMAIFSAIEDFIEQHVRSVSNLSGVPATLWGTDKESKRTIHQLDKTNTAHMKTLGMFKSWKNIKSSIKKAAK